MVLPILAVTLTLTTLPLVPPIERSPTAQPIRPALLTVHVPRETLAPMNDAPLGVGSFMTTLWAVEGPAFAIVMT